MSIIPTEAGPDTICECGHWYEEHNAGICEGCDAGGHRLIEHAFAFDPIETSPEFIADRGGDPDAWPDWVKAAIPVAATT